MTFRYTSVHARLTPGVWRPDAPWNSRHVFSFADATRGWAIGTHVRKSLPDSVNPPADESLYHTDDGGLSWAVVPTDLRQWTQDYFVDAVDFVDQKNGFASASDPPGQKLLWLKTSDGGRTWAVVRTT